MIYAIFFMILFGLPSTSIIIEDEDENKNKNSEDDDSSII